MQSIPGGLTASGKVDKLYPTFLFLVQRIALSGLGLVLYWSGYAPLTADPVYRPCFGIPLQTSGISGALLGVWQRFDVIHFLRIAQSGYSQPDLAAFYPLFPLLSGRLGRLLGGSCLLGSFIVANLCALLAVNALYFWMLAEGYTSGSARQTLRFLLWFPTAFFFFVPYSESLFLLLAILCVWSARQGKWFFAGLAASLAALTRLCGVVLAVLILAEWYRQWDKKFTRVSWYAWFSAALPLLASAGWALWLGWQRLPGQIEVQAAYWGRRPALPWAGILETFLRIQQKTALPVELLDLMAVLGMLLLGLVMLKKLPASLLIYHWGTLLLVLSQSRNGQPFSGQARYAAVLFPAFMFLGQYVVNPLLRRVLEYTWMAANLFLAGQFILWGWVG